MGVVTSHARRRLIALLLARGEIGAVPEDAPARDDAPLDRDGAGERATPAPARFERDDSADRAA